MKSEKVKEMLDSCYMAKRILDMLPKLPEGVLPSYVRYLETIIELEEKNQKVKVSDVSEVLNLPRPGVTRTIHAMEEKGYLKIYKIAKSDAKGFYYEYELLDAAEPDTPALIVIRKDGTIVDKEQENNDNPIEIVEQPEETTDESVSSVIEHTEKKEIQEENSENSNKESYDYQTTVEKVNNQIGYDDAVELYKMLNSQYSDNAIKMISVLRDIIVEILLCKKDTIYIAGENRNIDMVKAIFKKITSSHIDNVITTCAEVFKDGTNTVTNPKNYLTASLYNSVANGTFANIYP